MVSRKSEFIMGCIKWGGVSWRLEGVGTWGEYAIICYV